MSPIVASLLSAPGFGQQHAAEPEATRINRVFAAGQVWGTVKHFHPYFAYRKDIAWDKALITTLERINRSTTDEDYAAIIAEMMKTIGDPVTRLIQPAEQARPSPRARELVHSTDDGVLVVSLRDYSILGKPNSTDKLATATKRLGNARVVLIDLRPLGVASRTQMKSVMQALSDAGFASALTTRTLFIPANRRRVYTGYADPPTNFISAGFQVTNGRRIASGRSGKDVPVVFIVDPRSAIPPEAVAFQTAGTGAIIAQEGASDESLIDVQTMDLPGGLTVQFRLSELVTEKGAITFRPDLVIPTEKSDAAVFKRALTFARHLGSRSHTPTLPAIALPVAENAYPEMGVPAREYRLLAAFRIWSVIRFFFPARDMMSKDWDSVVKQAIPNFEGAHDALEYSLAVAELVHHLQDSHGFVTGPEIDEQFGATPPVLLEIVEGVPVVVAVRDADVQRGSAIEVGDVVTAIDGEQVEKRIAFWAKVVSASTPQFERFKVAKLLLAGREGSLVEVTLRRADRVERIKLRRTEKHYEGLDAFAGGLFKGVQRIGPAYKILPGNIGYADLDRLDEANVPEMFELFRDTVAIIFDMRGYPHHSPWSIVGRLNNRENVPASIYEESQVSSPAVPNGISRNQAIDYVDVGPGDYHGKAVLLIDGRAVSQAEHLALSLKAAGAILVGSATAGADCIQTGFSVPGGVKVYFSGALVREPGGRLIQRAGLLPDVPVEPTIEGIRAGRDEVLDRAVKVILRSSQE